MIPQKGNSSSPHMLTKYSPSQLPIPRYCDRRQESIHCKSNKEIGREGRYPYVFAIPHRRSEAINSRGKIGGKPATRQFDESFAPNLTFNEQFAR